MTEKRLVIQIKVSSPRSEVVVEIVVAMAAASLVFKSTNSVYSRALLKHAN